MMCASAPLQVADGQQQVSAKEAELAAAVAGRADAEQQLDRISQHLDGVEAQLQEAQAAKFKAEVRAAYQLCFIAVEAVEF
jgi:hypothetical protein